MVTATTAVEKIIQSYLQELLKNDIPVQQAIIFGSYAKGSPKEESDIDVVLVSKAFTGDRFKDRRRIIPPRRPIDNRIDPIPFRPENFSEGGNPIDEIKKTGKEVDLRAIAL